MELCMHLTSLLHLAQHSNIREEECTAASRNQEHSQCTPHHAITADSIRVQLASAAKACM